MESLNAKLISTNGGASNAAPWLDELVVGAG
ncbi:hypothetical protein AVHM3334_02930 [Acidovorax sp. SUPP3334]|nr:hypothetical protein AVHM3334_02930 [Acidovorax sp. SUPP3334]